MKRASSFLVFLALTSAGASAAGKPNIILILADDFGHECVTANGRSFLPQLLGQEGSPREWLYAWYSPRQQADMTVREYAFNQRYKLYRDGSFFNLAADPREAAPLRVTSIEGEAAAAARLLQGALDQFNDARPPELDRASQPAAKGKTRQGKTKVKR